MYYSRVKFELLYNFLLMTEFFIAKASWPEIDKTKPKLFLREMKRKSVPI